MPVGEEGVNGGDEVAGICLDKVDEGGDVGELSRTLVVWNLEIDDGLDEG